MTNQFFSKNKKTALSRLKKLCKEDRYYCKFKDVKLARKQIDHSSNWKTWEYRK